jgi:dihydrofolate reductase
MGKLVVSEWMTLDGVFDADTMKEWFEPYDSDDRQKYIIDNVQTSDAFLAGRVTYEMLASYWPKQKDNFAGIADKLNSAPKYVVSTTLEKAEWNNSTIIKEDVADEIARLKQQLGQILIFGSATLVESLMKVDLIDEYRFLIHPIIMGSGKRFFREGMTQAKLNPVKTQTLNRGVILDCYAPAKSQGKAA